MINIPKDIKTRLLIIIKEIIWHQPRERKTRRTLQLLKNNNLLIKQQKIRMTREIRMTRTIKMVKMTRKIKMVRMTRKIKRIKMAKTKMEQIQTMILVLQIVLTVLNQTHLISQFLKINQIETEQRITLLVPKIILIEMKLFHLTSLFLKINQTKMKQWITTT